MKRVGKPVVFIVLILILAFSYTAFFGIQNYFGDKEMIYFKGAKDIRWGIDIQGGVEAIFAPDDVDLSTINTDQMAAAEAVINVRLTNLNITDSEVYTDTSNKQIIVRFPWKSEETDFDPEAAIAELGETAVLKFCRESDSSDVIMEGSDDIVGATAVYNSQDQQWQVALELTDQGTDKFAAATSELIGKTISIWMDDTQISAPTVNSVISDGNAVITGDFDNDSAKDLADKINAGALPFKLSVDQSKLKVITPTLGERSLEVMLWAGIIAFVLVCIFMIIRYRLMGVIASISLLGIVAGMFACVSGYFPGVASFTLTIPGIAGMILSIGMGVDANVITSERVREELRNGKTLDGSINTGYQQGLPAIIDGNVTVVIVSIILMGAFGPPTSIWAKIVTPLMFMFKSSITGSIYSFGYTLLVGVIFNMIMGVTASRLMTKSLSRFKPFRKLWMYGGGKNA